MSLATTSSEPSPEPLFDMHDLHGQAALHVAARLGQAQVVKVLQCAQFKYSNNIVYFLY